MALVAARVRRDRTGMGRADGWILVTGGTVAIRLMMILVTGQAAFHLRISRKAHRRGVALDALDPAVLRVLELHRSRATRVIGHAHRYADRPGRRKLGVAVAVGAITPGGALMMADLTAAWRRERQIAALRRGAVAGDTGESAMAFMGEGVGGEGRGCVSLPPRSARVNQPARLLERLGGIERQRRPHPPATLSDFGMAASAVARIHPRGVGLMAGLTALGHLPVGLADMVSHNLPRFASKPEHDPRAPQNLQPVGALEKRLRHELGDQRYIRRLIEDSLFEEMARV